MSESMRLLAVEAAGIQNYIFSSNRLKENIGASYLVAAVTGAWALQAVRDCTVGHNLNGDALDDAITIDQENTAVEVLYAGGGNFVALFKDESDARQFTQLLSKQVLQEAPGLRLNIHSVLFRWGEDVLAGKLRELFDGMKQRRAFQPAGNPLAGLGVTVMCASTALPAVRREDGQPASAEVNSKRRFSDDANQQLADQLPLNGSFTYPLDLDNLGRTRGESSLIAIVHADGDGIGARMQLLGEKYTRGADVRDHIRELRDFSRKLSQAATSALKETLNDLTGAYPVSSSFADLFLQGQDNSGKHFLPFRPLVFGGDDVTFVCDGRIGIALTLAYLRHFEQQTQTIFGEKLTSCAGIAIVKSHYPFARAYEVAEALCKSAKRAKRDAQSDGSFMDWHFTTGGLIGELSEIRRREYQVSAGSLSVRPVALDGSTLHSWETVRRGLDMFQGEDWREKRNKVKTLREKLRQGPGAVKEYTRLYEVKLDQISGAENGWAGEYCPYFDAIELMDLYLPLPVREADAAHT